MAESLTPARATLLAAHLAAAADITKLRNLISLHPQALTSTIVLRILLLFVPETTEPSEYAGLAKDVASGAITPWTATSNTPPSIDISSVEKINEPSARKILENINVLPLPEPAENHEGNEEDPLSSWLIARARRIDDETGVFSIADNMLTPFIETKPEVYTWYTGIIQVLSKLVYAHPELGPDYGLAKFESLDEKSAVNVLLSKSSGDSAVRDVEELVAPYVRYRRKLAISQGRGDPWRWVWSWMAETAASNFDLVVSLVEDWDGPDDDDLCGDYARAAISGCYLCTETGAEVIEGMHSVIGRVAEIRRLPIGTTGPFEEIVQSVKTNARMRRDDMFTQDVLMESECKLTEPSEASLGILDSLVRSAEILAPYLTLLPMSGIANVRLQGSKEEQLSLLVGLIRSGNWTSRTDKEWKKIRDGALWLCAESKVFGQLTEEQVETELLKGMLSSTRFKLVSELYVGKRRPPPLPNDVVENAILHSVIHEFYDNATNGNKTRGSMKNAQNALSILYPNHSSSLPLAKAARLISATHALSNYSLTLTPGVILKPLQIRIHPDPPSLISRVLQQNLKSYTQVDTLLAIARDLQDGTSPTDAPLKGSSDPTLDARITGMCVEAALVEDDFETAYSLIMAKLIKRTRAGGGANTTTTSSDTTSGGGGGTSEKDVAWQSCLQAGRYRPPNAGLESETGFLSLRQLEMRMDLLSQALLICPPVAITEILSLWTRCEGELNELLEQEAAEEERHANLGRVHSDSLFPSGFPSSTSGGGSGGGAAVSQRNKRDEEGPMSLFEMAAGATRVAKSLGSSAFPLRGARTAAAAGQEEYGENADGDRVRKRDMLSGMVTSGLASGLGWVIGANPNEEAVDTRTVRRW